MQMRLDDTTQRPTLEPLAALAAHDPTGEPVIEAGLARVYAIGLGVGAAVFVIGLVLGALGLRAPWVFWAGIGALVLVPGVAAAQSALSARRSGDAPVFRSILLTAAALLLAVVLGLLISRR
jgi:hypothetical protein